MPFVQASQFSHLFSPTHRLSQVTSETLEICVVFSLMLLCTVVLTGFTGFHICKHRPLSTPLPSISDIRFAHRLNAAQHYHY